MVASSLGFVRVSSLAGAQYVGGRGTSQTCLEALRHIVQRSIRAETVLLLSADDTHAFLFEFEVEGPLIVKDGFSSGYGGEGPKALADALMLLRAAQFDVDEVKISLEMMQRLSCSALGQKDLETIAASPRVRPMRWHDYIYDIYKGKQREESVWQRFQPVMPWGILDIRVTDLALTFFDAPDKSIMDGFRRMEDLLRRRTGLTEHGVKLFQAAFLGEKSALTWTGLDSGEQVGRAQLFTGSFQAFRNPRAHRTPKDDARAELGEFLLLNQLFLLEAESVARPLPAE